MLNRRHNTNSYFELMSSFLITIKSSLFSEKQRRVEKLGVESFIQFLQKPDGRTDVCHCNFFSDSLPRSKSRIQRPAKCGPVLPSNWGRKVSQPGAYLFCLHSTPNSIHAMFDPHVMYSLCASMARVIMRPGEF